jgi:hypothetical protein
MNGCLSEADLKNLSNDMLLGFENRIASIPADMCAPFHYEARQLETELLTIHKFVAICCSHTEDLPQVARNWGLMVSACDESAKKLHSLVEKHPYCGAEQYYDRVLDLRGKCLRLQQMHS